VIPGILSDPQVMMGSLLLLVSTSQISSSEKLGSGESIEAVLESHPRLTRETGLAALRFAAQDFGELVLRQGIVHSGVVLLRLEGVANMTKAGIVSGVYRGRAAELIGAFSVVSPGSNSPKGMNDLRGANSGMPRDDLPTALDVHRPSVTPCAE
jgi:uncharacterized protein (DUF433 family)